MATHIVGGELYYRYLGNNNYEIKLVVYRDCVNGVPPFDYPASVGIFTDNNVLYTELLMYNVDSITIPSTINNPCYIPPTNVCYRQATYTEVINLPPGASGYQLAYQRCCRNYTILNIVGPLSTGATFYARIPSFNLYGADNNPVFNNLPPPFICLGLPFVFDHSASDADGDSVSYELCIPYNGADTLNPAPQPPFNPPYSSITWNSPTYGLNNMIGGNPPMSIDPVTGILTAYPNTVGQFVIGVCANEWRNGISIGKTRRDYQLNVVPCPSIVVAALQNPIILCGSNTVTFLNNSFGANAYQWNFGDPGATNDTSVVFSPSYTYPDTGSYTVTLVAHSAFNPACTDTAVGTVHINPPFHADFGYSPDLCNLDVSFFDSSLTAGDNIAQWSWNFGDNQTSTVHNPVHTYSGTGTYTVTFISKSVKGCRDTVVKTITVLSSINASITTVQNVSCNGSCNGEATINITSGTPPFSILWSDSQAQTTPTAINLCPGNYSVTVVDSNNCSVTKTINITEPPPLTKTISGTDAYCNGMCIGTATVNASGGTPVYHFLWNDPGAQTTAAATHLCPGIYTVLVTDQNGCTVTDSVTVVYSTYVPSVNATTDLDTVFVGQPTTVHANTTGSYTYSWVPPSWLSSTTVANPIATPQENTTYYVTITDANGCSNTDSVRIYVKTVICSEPLIFIPNAFSPNGDLQNDVLYVRGTMIRELLLRIYDRWGEKVFESNSISQGWDGTYKGKAVTPGVFVYYLEATCYNNEKFFKKGNITVIR